MRAKNPGILALLTCCIFCNYASHASSPSPFSQYGVIQNVQKYSTQPGYDPNGPYNMRMPQPVYATGPKIDSEDCQTIVYNLIISQCALLNNCASTTLQEIRPAILLQLSRISNGNYISSCSGYLDTAFEQYKANYTTSGPSGYTPFPNATAPNPNAYDSGINIPNPFAPQTPEWAKEMQERKKELESLQSQNGANNVGLQRASFPTTYADLSFAERIANEAKGYEPYKDNRAYTEIEIESEEEYLTRQQNLMRIKDSMNMTIDEFCKKYPDDTRCVKTATNNNGNGSTPTTSTDPKKQALIDRIIAAFPK